MQGSISIYTKGDLTAAGSKKIETPEGNFDGVGFNDLNLSDFRGSTQTAQQANSIVAIIPDGDTLQVKVLKNRYGQKFIFQL